MIVSQLGVTLHITLRGKVRLLESGARRREWLPPSVFFGLCGGREIELGLRVWIFQSI